MAKKVFLDETIKEQILGTTEHVEFCGNDGQRIGHFVSVEEYDEYERMLYATMKDAVSTDELDASFNEPGGISTQELLSRLNAL